MAALTVAKGQPYDDLLGGLSAENVERIKRQNTRKISVFIGNPPYNANQLNENNNNKNRTYPQVDAQIKATYVAKSRAQKTAAYDMYARFYRWATDRLRDEGIVAFVTNRSFLDSRTFDGFRATVVDEFNAIWVMDLGGDIRANPKLSGTKHNVFGIQTGVTIGFFVRLRDRGKCRIFYARLPEFDLAEDKLAFLGSHHLSKIHFDELTPDAKFNWLPQSDNDFDLHMPVASNTSKRSKAREPFGEIFQLSSTGMMTGRDDWVYDFDSQRLAKKMSYFQERYLSVDKYTSHEKLPPDIKWSRDLIRKIGRKFNQELSDKYPRIANFRPFTKKMIFASDLYIDELGAFKSAFAGNNIVIAYLCMSSANPIAVLASDKPVDYGLLKQGNGGTQVLYRYRFSGAERIDNITNSALEEFRSHYHALNLNRLIITKDAIFHYVYGVLHDPIYREKYALNLKREFPRIPFYDDFWRWAEWGERLMKLHIGYESVEPWPLRRIDVPDERSRKAGLAPRTILRADKTAGVIVLDSDTQLGGVPKEAWDYRLGNRSALEWVLDQHKEKTPRDPTIREHFNTYRFADHKERVIDLLMRVTRVSVETMAIVADMRSVANAR